MELKRLVTLSFDKNVGTGDRILRLVGGAALTGGGWYLGVPTWASGIMIVLGLMAVLTAILAKCSIYYLLGYSTCPMTGDSSPLRRSAS